jgi:hypothetical protein
MGRWARRVVLEAILLGLEKKLATPRCTVLENGIVSAETLAQSQQHPRTKYCLTKHPLNSKALGALSPHIGKHLHKGLAQPTSGFQGGGGKVIPREVGRAYFRGLGQFLAVAATECM